MDIIGDLHGCAEEAQIALESMGHKITWPKDVNEPADVTMAPGRTIAFVGDITDRGPRSVDTLRLLEGTLAAGGVSVTGNHDNKLLRALAGHKLNVGNGLEQTLEQLEGVAPETRDRFRDMLLVLPHQIKAKTDNPDLSDDGYITIVHAAAPLHHQDQVTKNSAARAMYGYADGTVDSKGNLIRDDWAASYVGERGVFHGHTPMGSARLLNKVGCLDTGAVFGGHMSVLSTDTGLITQVPSGFCGKEREGITRSVVKLGDPFQTRFYTPEQSVLETSEKVVKVAAKSTSEDQR
jgi:protein phosphatase